MSGKLRRFVIGNASECKMDDHGQLLLPEKLRKISQMDKSIVLVGRLNKFEVWNDDAWMAKKRQWR